MYPIESRYLGCSTASLYDGGGVGGEGESGGAGGVEGGGGSSVSLYIGGGVGEVSGNGRCSTASLYVGRVSGAGVGGYSAGELFVGETGTKVIQLQHHASKVNGLTRALQVSYNYKMKSRLQPNPWP